MSEKVKGLVKEAFLEGALVFDSGGPQPGSILEEWHRSAAKKTVDGFASLVPLSAPAPLTPPAPVFVPCGAPPPLPLFVQCKSVCVVKGYRCDKAVGHSGQHCAATHHEGVYGSWSWE